MIQKGIYFFIVLLICFTVFNYVKVRDLSMRLSSVTSSKINLLIELSQMSQGLHEKIPNLFKKATIEKAKEQISKNSYKLYQENINYGYEMAKSQNIIQNQDTKRRYFRQQQQKDDPNLQIYPLNLKFQPKFRHYLKNFQAFYHKHNIQNIVIINCNQECQSRIQSRNKFFLKETVTYVNTIAQIAFNQEIEWLHIYHDKQFDLARESVQKIEAITTRFSKLKGFTFLWKNLYYFNQHNNTQMIKELANKNWYYHEIQSLNLRLPQGSILQFFSNRQSRKPPKYKVETQPIRNQISISVQFLVQENLPYLREFIAYHLNLGIDKFFLFDNTGTAGDGSATARINKYGYSLDCFGFSKEKIVEEWDEIWEDFYNHIIYIPYQPLDREGEIAYKQVEQLVLYQSVFSDVTKYTSFTDIDELLVSHKGYDLLQFLQQKSRQGCGCISIQQQKFLTRFCQRNKKVIQMDKFIDLNTKYWAVKNICKTSGYIPGRYIHKAYTSEGQICPIQKPDLKFNHYNLNLDMISWMFQKYQSPVKPFESDQFLLKYKADLDQACNGKCSESFSIGCNIPETQSLCPFHYKVEDYERIKKKNG